MLYALAVFILAGTFVIHIYNLKNIIISENVNNFKIQNNILLAMY